MRYWRIGVDSNETSQGQFGIFRVGENCCLPFVLGFAGGVARTRSQRASYAARNTLSRSMMPDQMCEELISKRKSMTTMWQLFQQLQAVIRTHVTSLIMFCVRESMLQQPTI